MKQNESVEKLEEEPKIHIKDAIKENTVIHCETIEEADRILKMAIELGYTWKDGRDYRGAYHWSVGEWHTCYCIFTGMYGSIKYFDNSGYAIIPSTQVADLEPEKSTDWTPAPENIEAMNKKEKAPTITGIMADFLDSIRAYEHESGEAIYFDERESSEFVNMYFNNGGKLKIEEKYCDCNIPIFTLNSTFCRKCLKDIEERKPLFVTEDGVNLFDLCQTVYLIHPKTLMKQKSDLGYFSTNDLDNNNLFYHEANADKYIWRNKRVFSYEDIRTSIFMGNEKLKYIKLAKERVEE